MSPPSNNMTLLYGLCRYLKTAFSPPASLPGDIVTSFISCHHPIHCCGHFEQAVLDQCRILKFKGFVFPSFIFFSDALSEGTSVDLFSGELILALLSRQVCYGKFPQFLRIFFFFNLSLSKDNFAGDKILDG